MPLPDAAADAARRRAERLERKGQHGAWANLVDA